VVFAQYVAAQSQAKIYSERILPKAQRSLDLVTKGYEGSELRYIDLLNAQRTYFRARLAHLEVLWSLRTAAAKIESFLLEGSLEAGK
jgi:cobalt-zinc-cadmium efflux system outer membrane protein